MLTVFYTILKAADHFVAFNNLCGLRQGAALAVAQFVIKESLFGFVVCIVVVILLFALLRLRKIDR